MKTAFRIVLYTIVVMAVVWSLIAILHGKVGTFFGTEVFLASAGDMELAAILLGLACIALVGLPFLQKSNTAQTETIKSMAGEISGLQTKIHTMTPYANRAQELESQNVRLLKRLNDAEAEKLEGWPNYWSPSKFDYDGTTGRFHLYATDGREIWINDEAVRTDKITPYFADALGPRLSAVLRAAETPAPPPAAVSDYVDNR